MLRARTYHYPIITEKDAYIDTTYYDEEAESLDVGYQRLKVFNPKRYPELTIITTLFISHNNLTELPDPKLIPNLESIDCSYNKLTEIPFYPKLKSLSMTGNNVKYLTFYGGSKLRYLDCSFNINFSLDIHLPFCKYLFCNDCQLDQLDLKYVPKLTILECGNNFLTSIGKGFVPPLIELGIQNNQIEHIEIIPSLKRLLAEDNKLTKIDTFPELISLYACNNNLVKISSQPRLQKIIAQNNKLQSVGLMPELKIVDLGYNKLRELPVFPNLEYFSIHFNPTTKVTFDKNNLKTIKEAQVNFDTYCHIYQNYYDHFQYVHIQTDPTKVEKKLGKLVEIFDTKTIQYIKNKFINVKFMNSNRMIEEVSKKIYVKYYLVGNKNDSKDKSEYIFSEIDEFIRLKKIINKLYFKTLIITLFFNANQLMR